MPTLANGNEKKKKTAVDGSESLRLGERPDHLETSAPAIWKCATAHNISKYGFQDHFP